MLTTNSLSYLAQLIHNFCGVYSINTLPMLQDLNCHHAATVVNNQQQQQGNCNPKTLIVNLDTDNLPGSHWVAIAAEGGVIEIFDSFGLPLPPLLQSWASAQQCRWIYEPLLMVQKPDAITCGYYALIFCIARCYFNTLLETICYIDTLKI